MPTYVYRCPRCEHEEELIQSFRDRKAPFCSLCVDPNNDLDGPMEMESIIQPSSFVLKGSCWARDGYKK